MGVAEVTIKEFGMKMNEGQEIYLKTYSAVDKVDQMLNEWQLDYISWK